MFTKAPPVCARVSGLASFPFDPQDFAPDDETLVGFTAQTSDCEQCFDGAYLGRSHVQIDGWLVLTDKGMYEVDNAGIVYRSRMVHPFKVSV